MTPKEPPLVFIDSTGNPLPDWLQKALRRQAARLRSAFPALRDKAALQNILDGVGQRIFRRAQAGHKIKSVHSYVESASVNAAVAYSTQSDGFHQAIVTLDENGVSTNHTAPSDPVLIAGLSQALNRQEEEIVIRIYWHGQRHQEIAESLNLTEGTVRKKYSRALEKLRRHFGGGVNA